MKGENRMNILRKGDVPQYWYGHCQYCNAIIQYDRTSEELCECTTEELCDLPDVKFVYKCPECKKTLVTFYREDLSGAKSILNDLYK
jgi:hypothetical protein